MPILINNLTQIIALLILPLTLLLSNSKIKSYFNASFAQRNKKINNIEANNLTLEKSIIIIFQILILILNKKTTLISTITVALILFLHLIICSSFLITSNEKIKIWNNLFNIKFIILITIICSQLLFISWQFHNIIFIRNNSFFWIIIFNSIFLYMIVKLCNQALLISNYLLSNTFKILTSKKSDNFYFNQKKIYNFYSKTEAISNLWNFENLKHSKELNLTNKKGKQQKIIKDSWIIFIISCTNLFCKNIIKTQKIIINGWKNSLVE